MGEVSYTEFDWSNPWAEGDVPLIGDTYNQGFRFLPVGGWETSFEADCLDITFTTTSTAYIGIGIEDTNNATVGGTEEFEYFSTGVHTVRISLAFIGADIDKLIFNSDLKDGSVTVNDISFPLDCSSSCTKFWTNHAGQRELN